jgi:hypothetical protein
MLRDADLSIKQVLVDVQHYEEGHTSWRETLAKLKELLRGSCTCGVILHPALRMTVLSRHSVSLLGMMHVFPVEIC